MDSSDLQPDDRQALAAPPSKSPRALRWFASLAALQLLLSIRFPWDSESTLDALLRPSPDLFFALALALALVLLIRSRLIPAICFTSILALIPIFRGASTLVPDLYGKPLVVYNDVMMLPGLVHIAFLHTSGPGRVLWIVGLVLATVLALVAIYRLVSYLLLLAPTAGPRRMSAQLWLVFGTAGVTGSLALQRDGNGITQAPVLLEVAQELDVTVLEWGLHREFRESLPNLHREREAAPSNLARLEGADVFVLFVESYGRSLFRKPERREALAELATELTSQLDQAGFYVCSSFATSSVSGGSSSLAHAQFMSGCIVRSKHYFASLLASDLKPLPHRFNAANYRTLNAQPATTAEWPEGKFFGFQEDIFNDAFDYTGHTYHWGFMPDQFALAYLLEEEIKPSTQPIFMQYVSVTSHAPFSMIPPYFEEWSEVRAPHSFNRFPEKTYPIDVLALPNCPNAESGYADTIAYSLKTMVGFVCELERPSIVILIGDHQPPGIGDLSDYDSSFDVPMHVISNRADLLQSFGKAGFQEGFFPADEYQAFELSLFADSFLASFSTDTSESGRDQ